ncbi:hypothetical protein A3I18_00685 [Candidatus Campbellbacteria bacterium RIFCSPLOWO2_02_FULL_35_11]|uniref:Prepilin-type N-terminal cleavage/methylation domain-containing protein n=2 Tax=Candidatus Campbelliibacteriota TaxID=1752727 RepID=A0A1F5EP63_9BACT|nr:MAG: hypothetical protein A3E89_01235 [Candidatus Campbellbacteria bacterium RIFCSPHIGHO2_12_FULL_35_10]OGD69899.1 MAG: hypothetical protein A3I18_00685 [Candidatus Campbellbacteria bacterium RIFCSPLOWO2_02_FULL_35_11]
MKENFLKTKNQKKSENLRSKFLSLKTKTCLRRQDYKLFSSLGFTLVEVVLYISVVITIISASSVFLATIVQSRIKNETVSEVEQQGIQIMRLISDTVRNADLITSPVGGSNGSFLTLDALGTLNDPTIFSVNNGVLYVSEGGRTSVPLTNTYVQVSNFIIQNVSRPGTLGLIRISFVVNYLNSSGRKEYSYSKTFYGSASIR